MGDSVEAVPLAPQPASVGPMAPAAMEAPDAVLGLQILQDDALRLSCLPLPPCRCGAAGSDVG
eukprot:907112-Alexandrium_andersonii.AAC.1